MSGDGGVFARIKGEEQKSERGSAHLSRQNEVEAINEEQHKFTRVRIQTHLHSNAPRGSVWEQ